MTQFKYFRNIFFVVAFCKNFDSDILHFLILRSLILDGPGAED